MARVKANNKKSTNNHNNKKRKFEETNDNNKDIEKQEQQQPEEKVEIPNKKQKVEASKKTEENNEEEQQPVSDEATENKKSKEKAPRLIRKIAEKEKDARQFKELREKMYPTKPLPLIKSLLVVKNIPSNTDILKACMMELGTVKQILPGGNIAYVQFTEDLTDDALEYDGASLNGKEIKIRFATEMDYNVFVFNSAESVDEEVLANYMQEIGTVESIVNVSEEEGVLKRAYKVKFADLQSAIAALEYHGAEIHGIPVAIISGSDKQTAINQDAGGELVDFEAANALHEKRQRLGAERLN